MLKKPNIDKRKLIARIAVFVAVTVTFLVLGVTLLIKGQVVDFIVSVIIISTLLALAIPYVLRAGKSLKRGLPLEDERSRRVRDKAAAFSFYVSLYLLLGISYFSDYVELRVGQAIGAGILGMAATFGLSYLYFDKKGIMR
jgi:hypothetical protein